MSLWGKNITDPLGTDGHDAYHFGGFTLDLSREALLRGETEVPLRAKTFAVLKHLVARAGTLATRDELLDTVWPGAVVTQDTLTQSIVELRRALEDDQREIIRTVPRRGFIFELPVSRGPIADTRPLAETLVQPLRTEPTAGPRLGRRRLVPAAVLLIGVALWWALPDRSTGAFIPMARSVAVLPFEDMSAQGNQAWFGDGMAEEITNRLARQPQLQVIARTSSFAFKDRHGATINEIARALKVAYVLEGGVRLEGERVRITAQLVETVTSTQVWSARYDRSFGDLLAIQEDISAAVAESLQVTLAEVGGQRPGLTSIDPGSYEAYFKGRFFYNRRGAGDVALARHYFERAVALDPANAAAWTGLSGVYGTQVSHGRLSPDEGLALMGEAVGRALALAPDEAEVQSRAGRFAVWTGDRDRARRHRLRAQSLDPDNWLVLSHRAKDALIDLDFTTALALQRRVAALDPLSPLVRNNLAWYLVSAGHYEEAITEAGYVVELNPDLADHMAILEAEVRLLQDRPDEALAILDAHPRRVSAPPNREDLEWIKSRALALHGIGRFEEATLEANALAEHQAVESAIALAEYRAWTGDADGAFAVLDDLSLKISDDSVSASCATHVVPSSYMKRLHADARWAAFRETVDAAFPLAPPQPEAEAAADL